MKNELKLIPMSEIETEEVRWLWYPYIPLGKVTIIQGDPGEGKTTFVLAIISALTKGEALPECDKALEPMNVIYQTAEDGLADTIKPRLVHWLLLLGVQELWKAAVQLPCHRLGYAERTGEG